MNTVPNYNGLLTATLTCDEAGCRQRLRTVSQRTMWHRFMSMFVSRFVFPSVLLFRRNSRWKTGQLFPFLIAHWLISPSVSVRLSSFPFLLLPCESFLITLFCELHRSSLPHVCLFLCQFPPFTPPPISSSSFSLVLLWLLTPQNPGMGPSEGSRTVRGFSISDRGSGAFPEAEGCSRTWISFGSLPAALE